MASNGSSSLDDVRRRALLAELQAMGSDADAHEEITKVFLPLPTHAAALQAGKLIVRGERGAGKTALFHLLRALSTQRLALDVVFPGAMTATGRWTEGFSERGKTHPSTDVLDLFGHEAEDGALRSFWFGHLVGVLVETFPDVEAPEGDFLRTWRRQRTEPRAWVGAAQAEVGALTTWLDHLDDRCVREGTWVFVSYDHLDKIGILRAAVRRRFASTLLAMWLSLANRYERLRGKIFLREDLFQSALRGSTDASKLETRSVSLHWSTEDLYRVLLRHLSASTGLRDWLQAGPKAIPLAERPPLGWFPPDALSEEGSCSQRGFADKLAGDLMGEGVKKGYTHRWIPNHLQDAYGLIVPRPMLNLVAFAAQWALQRGPKALHSRLLHPTELQAALEKTSQYRATELQEEHPVVQRLKRLRGMVLLAQRSSVVQALQESPVGGVDDGYGADGDAVFEDLERLGVLKVRSDGRVDVPDIYRFGFGIKRKGGVARPH
jgi:hypothetical protein